MSGIALVTINENQWNVEVATTTTELIAGLSGRESIPAGTGMLFILPVRQVIAIQTNEMLFPLDIVFIKDNIVIDVIQNVSSGLLVEEATPCDGFLEINIGEADLVEIGDTVNVELLYTVQAPGFDISSIISFAIPLAVLGFVFGILPGGSSEKELKSGNPGSTEVYVEKLPMCDFSCGRQALYDGRTKQGPWAYMCEEHFKQYGTGLGTGKGQRLIPRKALGEAEKIRGEPEKELSVKMTERDFEESVSEGAWYPTCPYCGVKSPAEPDADYISCQACGRRFKIINPFFSSRYHSNVTVECPICGEIIEIPEYNKTTRSDALSKHIREKHGMESYPSSIYGEPRRRLVDKYGSWAVGRAEAVCPENDVKCVEREAERLSEVYRSRYGEGKMKYVTILTPGQTVFHIGDIVSEVALEKENRRVRELGENEATYQVALSKVIPEERYIRKKREELPDEIEFFPDSPEFLAYTIADIGYTDKLENAFKERMLKVRNS